MLLLLDGPVARAVKLKGDSCQSLWDGNTCPTYGSFLPVAVPWSFGYTGKPFHLSYRGKERSNGWYDWSGTTEHLGEREKIKLIQDGALSIEVEVLLKSRTSLLSEFSPLFNFLPISTFYNKLLRRIEETKPYMQH